jgi:hypothetical protein
MRGVALILAVGGLGLVIAAVALARWAQVPGDPFAVIGMLLLDADPIAKLALLVILGSLAFVVVSGGSALVRPQGGPSDGLVILGWIAAGLGVLTGLYGGMNIRAAMVRTNTTNLMVIAPSVAEVMLIAGIGLFVGALGLGIQSTLAARVARS